MKFQYIQKNNEEFAKLVTNLNSNGDTNTFLNKLTDIYPDYETFYRQDTYVNIKYPTKGFEVTLGAAQNNGITIYSNYQGKITENISITDIKNNKTSIPNVNFKLDENMVANEEEGRIYIDETSRHPYSGMAEIETNEYNVIE